MTDRKDQAKRVAEALASRPDLCMEVIGVLKTSWIPYAGLWVMTGHDGRWCRNGVFKDRMAATWPKRGQSTFGWGIATPGSPQEFGETGERKTIGEAAAAADEALRERGVSFEGCVTPFVPTVTPWSRFTNVKEETYFRLALPDREHRVVAVGRDQGGLWGILFGNSGRMNSARYADPHDAMRAADAALEHDGERLYPSNSISLVEAGRP